MKKCISLILLFLLLTTLSACGCEHKPSDNGRIQKKPTCVDEGIRSYTCSLCNKEYTEKIPVTEHTYEKEIMKEATFTEEGEAKYTCSVCQDSYIAVLPIRDDKVQVIVKDKKNIPADYDAWVFSDTVRFTIEVCNRTEKEIRGVEGILTIKDIFGKTILDIGCDFTGKNIPANGMTEYNDLYMEINEFIDTNLKVYSTSYEDLQFDYKITSIVYTDGTSESTNGD